MGIEETRLTLSRSLLKLDEGQIHGKEVHYTTVSAFVCIGNVLQ